MGAPTNQNECGVKTIFPLTVGCSTTNPSNATSQDGTASLVINGGTPPYTIQWANGLGSSQTITNLSGGEYTATVTDSKQDKIITTKCLLVQPTTTTTTSTTTSTTLPPCNDICLVLTSQNARANWDYFYNRH